ncbi:MAG TPA: Lrp/AsnC family transcriptional regulator [Acidimicrobiales bacterium]|jgi:DNA-binding Lrp family transcriptional regulator|nr:Lrp/AsnC family transcriptional regulator [Acidimicrobiales bacterium]
MLPTGIDELDARLITALAASPRSGVMELARQLQVARGTVQARLDKLQSRGVIAGFGPDLDLEALGYGVLAFVTLEIAQGGLAEVVAHLETIPEVIEAHSTTGPGDLHCRVVAQSNEHLQEVLSSVLSVSGIRRTSTQIALTSQIRTRVLPIVEMVVDEAPVQPATNNAPARPAAATDGNEAGRRRRSSPETPTSGNVPARRAGLTRGPRGRKS